ncbi:hypothetical protein KSC_024570 [Ktedonobacter sp. SOSP1-52]|nr:hypothetical protein KSC_024570 [Ktedonobacter sp. SOSP1-52]
MSVDLQRACLRDAKLTGADLTHANLEGVDLTGADLDGANLIRAYLSGVDLTGALGISLAPPPFSSRLISSHTHWRNLVVEAEENLLLGVATRSQVCEGLAAIEKQWRQYRPSPSAHSALASSSPPTGCFPWRATRLKRRLFAHTSTPKPEIVAITLLFRNTSPQGSTSRRIGDPLTLKNMLVFLNSPKNWVNLVRVIFEKRNGQQLVIHVVPNGQPPAACNVILGFAGIHTSCS